MRIGGFIGNIVKAAVVLGAVYAFMQWEVDEPQDDDVRDFAENDCINEIQHRFDTSTVNVYAIKETNDGYVVRATVTGDLGRSSLPGVAGEPLWPVR